MNVKLLIDGIVRQATVLLAQLSTTAGSRAPLARVTDEVFRNLAREIEAQGVGRPVVADMFGMALRSYQRKVQRLSESATQRDRTLWEAVLEFVQDERPTRARVLERFAHDGEKEVVSVLTDLVKTGLAFTTGSGRGAIYVPTQEDVRQAVMRDHDCESIENWLWLMVFRKEVRTRAEAHRALACEPSLVDEAIEELVSTGRLSWQGEELKSSNLVIPLGAEQGWETAVLDHFRTVAVAIAKKVSRAGGATSEDDETGGSTFTFTVSDGHPYEKDVKALLRTARHNAQSLWDAVAKYNREHPLDVEGGRRVSFYVGQVVEELDPKPSEAGEWNQTARDE